MKRQGCLIQWLMMTQLLQQPQILLLDLLEQFCEYSSKILTFPPNEIIF